MKNKIPQEILEIYKKIEDAGFQIYFVGGGVRNLLMNIPVKDWDLTTNAKPEDITKLFQNSYYNNDFGTVGIPLVDTSVVEVTTYRTEQGFSNKRHPDKVEWGKTIEEDLSRRDFTMNAIALKFANNKEEFVDPYDGRTDISKRIIRCVGNPKERFKEDALRLMRAIRFASQLNFDIDESTGKEIKADASLIKEMAAAVHSVPVRV